MILRSVTMLLLLLLQGLCTVHSFLVPPHHASSTITISTARTARPLYNSAREEAEALLAKARAMRQQVAELQGISLQQVEDEAKQRKRQILEAEQASQERRQQDQLARQETMSKNADGSFLRVPENCDEQIYLAKQAVERAFQSGITRQVVRFALLEQDQTLRDQDGQWPGGAQQMYRQAAGPLTRALLAQLKPLKRQQSVDNDESTTTTQSTSAAEDAWTRKKPSVTAQDVWDFDGSALVTAQWKSDGDDEEGTSTIESAVTATTIQALVQPNTDDKYTRDIESLGQALGPNQLLLLINPFWRNVDSWGINLLAPNAKKNAQRVIFDGDYQETFCLIQRSARGEDCIALKCYPYDWQLYAYADGEYWPFEPYLTHLGSTKEEPTGSDFTALLNEREEFKMSKNMRQLNRMRN